jgi:hypothetical protein
MEHSTPRETDPIDGATVIRRRRKVAGGTIETVAIIAPDAPAHVHHMVEDRVAAWEDRLAADVREQDAANRARREAAILHRLNRPHRRFARWLHSWRG